MELSEEKRVIEENSNRSGRGTVQSVREKNKYYCRREHNWLELEESKELSPS